MCTIETLKVKKASVYSTPITDAKAARGYFRLLWLDLGLTFHPDDSFAGYADNNGEPLFDEEAAKLLDSRMEECFDVLGEDELYNVMIDEGVKLNVVPESML